MDEETARGKYWDAVYALQAYIDNGSDDKEGVLAELEDDLT